MTNDIPLPPDRGHISTEMAHPDSQDLDAMDTRSLVDLLLQDQLGIHDSLAAAAAHLSALSDAIADRMARGGRLIYAGSGTSGRLGVLDAAECPPTFGTSPEQVIGIIAGGHDALIRSSESCEDRPDMAKDDLDAIAVSPEDSLVGISAGGTTPYVLGAIAHGSSVGCLTALLTCAPGASPAGCDHLVILDTGAEILTGSTRLKAGTATKIALSCLTTSIHARLGSLHGNRMVDITAWNDKLLDRAIRILQDYCPSLTREEAAAVINEAGGRLKTAIVMQTAGVDRTEAERQLDAADGVLRRVLTEEVG